jgi:cytosine/adenosine deaminase-related metal-dependent hydrolase
MAADLIGVDLNRYDLAGAQADPLAALVFCTPPTVDFSIINGRVVVEHGALVDVDLPALAAQHNRISRELLAAS